MSSSKFVSSLAQGLANSTPFSGPEGMERARARPFQARLGANENGFGPSPKAIAAMQNAAAQNWMYADPDSHDLTMAIADHHKLNPQNVLVGEGIDGLLGIALKATLDPGQTVVTSNGAYPTFNAHVACHAGRLIKVDYRDDKENLNALADQARRENAKIVYVSNPDNPMGSTWAASDLMTFEKSLPSDTVLFLDEAYCETAPNSTIPKLDPENLRLVRFRTFSKAYGLAGARIGYAIANTPIIQAMNKVRNQYGINRVGQIAAVEALRDQAYLTSVVEKIAQARDHLAVIAGENDLQALTSGANFVTIDCGRDGQFAKHLLDEVIKRDVFIRMPTVSPLDRCIRVSTGPLEDLERFRSVLPKALKAAHAKK